MSMEYDENPRPTGLTVLCILSFIGSSLVTFSFLIMALSYNAINEVLLYGDMFEGLPQFNADLMEELSAQILSAGPYYFWLYALLGGASLFGVIQMWRLKQIGFHIYAIAQILQILLSIWFMKSYSNLPWGAIFWTGLFILLYALYLKKFKKGKTDNNIIDDDYTPGNL